MKDRLSERLRLIWHHAFPNRRTSPPDRRSEHFALGRRVGSMAEAKPGAEQQKAESDEGGLDGHDALALRKQGKVTPATKGPRTSATFSARWDAPGEE